jgi:hypothetical protein
MSANEALRERVARANCRACYGNEGSWQMFLNMADAVLAELGLTQAEPVSKAESLTPKEAWWAGARAALGLPGDTQREKVASAFVIAGILAKRDEQAPQPQARPQAEPVAWRWPGGQWQDGEPSERDLAGLAAFQTSPEFAYAAPQPQAACSGCNGRGEIGGVMSDGSFQTDPCPWCHAPQPQASAQASAEDVALVDFWMSLNAGEHEAAWQRIRASLGVGK